ncbi:hypothetical protein ACHQM5_024424 [Ranunculus cassubicifolius]
MGCTSSKLDDLPAVALCRQRCSFLDTAIAQRYAFAEAHVAYTQSLKEIGNSLDRFFSNTDLLANNNNSSFIQSSSSPFLNLPPHRKGDPPVAIPIANSAAAAASVSISSPPAKVVDYPHPHSHSHSNSGHLEFQDSDDDDSDDDDDDDDGSLHHSGNSTPLHYQNHNYQDDETLNMMNGGGFMNMNFAKHRSTQSVVHRQPPVSTEKVEVNMNFMQNRSTQSVAHQQKAPQSSTYFPYNYENPNPNPYPYYNNYPQPNSYSNPQSNSYSNYGYYGGGQPPYGGGSGYPQQQDTGGASSSSGSSSKPPPPPPSPPRSSAWDFLNFFETVEKYYPDNNTPSRDSRSVREEEGIPDLEDENFQEEVVKEVYGEQRYSDASAKYSKKKKMEAEDNGNGGEGIYEGKQNVASEKDGMEYDVHVVDKKVVANEDRSEEKGNVAAFNAKAGSRGVPVSMVIREIKSQFERASESGYEVSNMLEAGKVQFHRKNAVYQVSSKMLHSITPSLSVVSSQNSKGGETSSNAGSVVDIDEGLGMRSGNLSATLQKLYIWEKKLYDEVKAEEKMRIVHERKVRRLKRLDEKGAESQKIDSTRTLVRSLSTKIRIAIQVVDKISVKINNLRDEELWPQINELIKGLIRMWKVMLECHKSQCEAIAEAKSLDALTSSWNLNGDHLQATIQLEHELLNWITNFSCWVAAQKGYVRALNNWLVKCLFYEPEVTDDGPVPFSPGRLGAPPVFVICNQWSQAMDQISEREVIDAMRVFTASVHQISERHNVEFRQRVSANKDMERKVKELEREEHKMQKEWQNTDKKMTMMSGQGIGAPQVVYQSDTVNTSLHLGLKQIFEAMERFTASSMQAYEELQTRCDEERATRENPKVP